jgi:hypothetical protein
MFPKGMATSATNPGGPRRQRVRSPRLVIIEFVLDDLPHIGTTGQLLYLSLAQNYVVAPDRLHTGGRGGLTWQAHCEFVESF